MTILPEDVSVRLLRYSDAQANLANKLNAQAGTGDLTAATYAAARLLVGTAGSRLQVLGRTTQSDGGQGLFTWVAGGTTTINDGIELTATGGIWKRTSDQPTTPLMFGAVGNGSADDTAAVQAAWNTLFCVMPFGKRFRIDHTLTVPTGATILGQGALANGAPGSALYANPVSLSRINGPVVQIGTGITAPFTTNIIFKDILIYGFARQYMLVQGVTNLVMDNIVGGPLNNNATDLCTDGFIFNAVFDSEIGSLDASGANFTTTLTFTASVGGATSGTLTGAIAYNGSYPAVFSDGQQRYISVTGTAVIWSTALNAGTITTAQIGCTFKLGGGFGPNVCNYWHAGSSGPYGLYAQDDASGGSLTGNTFNALVSEACTFTCYLGTNVQGWTLNSPYLQGGRPLVFGNLDTGLWCKNVVVNGPQMEMPYNTDASFGVRAAFIEFDNCVGITVNGACFTGQYGMDNLSQLAPVTISSGGGSGAVGTTLVNPSGIIAAIVLINSGNGYTSAPSVAIGGGGSGATATASWGTVATCTATFPNNSTMVVSAIGSNFPGQLQLGQTLSGAGVTSGTYITGLAQVTPAGLGVYQISNNLNLGSIAVTVSQITSLNLTAAGSGYNLTSPTATGGVPMPIRYGNARSVRVTGSFLRSWTFAQGKGSSIWPYVVRKSNSTDGSGVTITDDYAVTPSGFTPIATFTNCDYTTPHLLTWNARCGVPQSTVITPPVFP